MFQWGQTGLSCLTTNTQNLTLGQIIYLKYGWGYGEHPTEALMRLFVHWPPSVVFLEIELRPADT